MGLKTLAGGLLRRAAGLFDVERRSASGGWITAWDGFTSGGPTYTGRAVTPQTAMTYTAVWACVKILSEAVSSLPLLTYRNVSADGLVRNLAIEDYRYRMLREQPNDHQTSMQWREFGVSSLLL